jgi:hypothetical protein
MKRFVFIILSTLMLVSCLKTGSRNLGVYDTSNGYIRYQLNNYPIEINGGYSSFSTKGVGVFGRKLATLPNGPATRYTIFGQLSTKVAINMVVVTDSLKLGSYTTGTSTDGTTFARLDSIQYAGNRAEDVLHLTITRNSSGTVDGTFSGKLSLAGTAGGSPTFTDGVITNGVFQNVAINY